MGLVDLGLEGSDVGDAGLQFCEAVACVEGFDGMARLEDGICVSGGCILVGGEVLCSCRKRRSLILLWLVTDSIQQALLIVS